MKFFPGLIILMAIFASGSAGGLANFHCSTRNNSTIVIGCVEDCQQQHGEDTGVCGDVENGDHNCYCSGRRSQVPKRSDLQCKEMNDNFRNICTHDCICTHGADGGHCVWDLGVCHCENYGKNSNSMGCPVSTTTDWILVAKELARQKLSVH